MRIKMLVSVAGVGFSLAPGDVTDRFSEADAARLVQAKEAELIEPRKVETASRRSPAVEKR